MRVVVTRPESESGLWVDGFKARGFQVLALPLIEISPVADSAPVQEAWRRLGHYAAVMFVSGNAVSQFFAKRPADVAGFPARAWAPGPATAFALARAGVADSLIDAPAPDAAQFDSESLWQRVAAQVGNGRRILIVRGGSVDGQASGRDWLATQIEAAGASVDNVAAYVRSAPAWTPAQSVAATGAASDGSVWLLSSSESIGNLPHIDWSQARAIATHPRIAQAAMAVGFGVVCESLPTVQAIACALESIG